MALIFLDARVVHQPDVVVDVKVEEGARLAPGLGDYQVVKREVLRTSAATGVNKRKKFQEKGPLRSDAFSSISLARNASP